MHLGQAMHSIADCPCNRLRSRLRLAALAVVSVLPVATCWADTSLSAYYTGDFWSNTDGGTRTGSAYLSDAGLEIETDSSALFGVTNATAFAYPLWNNSNTLSDRYVGDAQVVSNIDAGQAVRIYELWYEQHLNEDVSLRFGPYDLNSEFDAIVTAGLFINSSHGIGADFGQSGRAGPSIFPVTSLAARFEMAINDQSRLRYAMLDGVPGDPNDPSKSKIDLGGGDGVRIHGFLRCGIANDDLNVFAGYFGAGAVATGLFSSRPDDQLSLALASARTGLAFDRAVGGADSQETSIELSYSTQVMRWLRVQPDLQYIINPGVDPLLKYAWVIGLRFEVATEHTIPHGMRNAIK